MERVTSRISERSSAVISVQRLWNILLPMRFGSLPSLRELMFDSCQIAVCNLGSIALPRFIDEKKKFDFNKLREVLYSVLLEGAEIVCLGGWSADS